MKNLVLATAFAVLVSACSSGTTVSDVPSNVTSRFVGTFQNTPGTQSGNVTLDILENDSGAVSGNIIFTSSGANCLSTSTVSGTTSGFTVSLSSPQSGDRFQITTTVVETDNTTMTSTTVSVTTVNSSSGTEGTTVSESTSGNITTTTTRVTTRVAVMGTLNIQFTSSNGGSTLSGTYTVSGDTCSNQTGSGTMTVSR